MIVVCTLSCYNGFYICVTLFLLSDSRLSILSLRGNCLILHHSQDRIGKHVRFDVYKFLNTTLINSC